MKKINTLNLALLCAIIASICAIILQRHLPEKSLVLVPGTDQLKVFTYSTHADKTPVEAESVDGKQVQWRCTRDDSLRKEVCGATVALSKNPERGLNLSGYSSLHVKLNYAGEAKKIRLVLRTFDKRFSQVSDSNSGKFHSVFLRQQDFNTPVKINLSEFLVAEWWVDQFGLRRDLARPDLSNVVSFAMDFVDDVPVGNHDVSLQELSVSGTLISPERWYLALLAVWILGGLILLGVRIVRHPPINPEQDQPGQGQDGVGQKNSKASTEKNLFESASKLDALTGIYNRLAIADSVAQLLADPRKNSIALILIDIDHFRRVNDRRGNEAGDELLKQFSILIASNIRNEDIFGRWDGEKFILVCPKTSIDSAFYFAEKLRKVICNSLFDEEKPLSITASFGVGTIMEGEDFADAIGRVNNAVAQAKSMGRNCTIIAKTHARED